MRMLAAVLLAAACGGSSSTVDQQGNCSASLTGAVTAGNVTCAAAAGTDGSGSGTGAIAVIFTSSSGASANVAIKTPSAPAAITYANTDTNANGECEVIQGNSFWVAAAGTPTSNQGSYSVSITGLGNAFNNPDGGPGTVYATVHGTANCTMPAIAGSGATGSVTLTATF